MFFLNSVFVSSLFLLLLYLRISLLYSLLSTLCFSCGNTQISLPNCPHFISRMDILVFCVESTTHTHIHTWTHAAEETEGTVHVWKAMG